jgi:RNA polymerase sigma-54 factor
MALELRQQLRLTQQLVMTPQLQQAIKLLQLSRLELLDVISQEIEENPVLEEGPWEPGSQESTDAESTPPVSEPVEIKPVTVEETARADIDWSSYLEEYNAPGPIHFETEEREIPEYDSFVARRQSLTEHLMWQLLLSLPSEREEKIGSEIIGNLDKDGYLQATIEEIAALAGEDIEAVESLLSKMQAFDPPGVCARDLRECLLIQMKLLGVENSIVTEIVKNHLKHVENKNYKAIARALGIRFNDVVSAVEIITHLEP